jgi:tyrosyl-tRNA synthetase
LGEGLPTIGMPKAKFDAGIPAFEAFRLAGLATSNGEARRLIKGGGGRVNDKAISDETHLVTAADLNEEGLVKLSAGRKRHALLRVS